VYTTITALARGIEISVTDSPSEPVNVDGRLLKQALLGSLTWLAIHQEEVNRLNVFPVPDGDTGTNMLLTLESAVEDIKETTASEISKVAALAAHGSLMGARGNSGVILSQIFRGFARYVQGKREVTPVELAGAFEEASNAAYRAANPPTEGTILTVAREAARAARDAALAKDATAVSVMKAASKAAKVAVDSTPDLLPILKDAGVVDAGGFGLQIMLEGFLKSFESEEIEAFKALSLRRSPAAQKTLAMPDGGWGYCTEFILEGSNLNVDQIREQIAAMGNSVLVVGEPEIVKVHVHTDDPTAVLQFASSLGNLARVNVGDMSSQHQLILAESSHDVTLGPPRMGVTTTRTNGIGMVAVVAGAGLVDIFKGLGVDAVIEGGQTMNPSTQDMLSAVDSVPYDEVILLPNNGNVIAAAAQVKNLTAKRIHVLGTRTVPQGVEAVVAFNSERDGTANVAAMEEAARQVQTIEVTRAVRNTKSNGLKVQEGDVIAVVNDHLKHAGSQFASVVGEAMAEIGADSRELVTVYRGEEASEADAEGLAGEIRALFPKLHVEVHPGGQPHYPFILSVQ
jgi:hypothetical protein